MTPCSITSAPVAMRAFVTQNFTGFVHDVIEGATRVYLVSFVSARGTDQCFADPIDGELLVECKFFDNEKVARSWVAADIALHDARAGGVH